MSNMGYCRFQNTYQDLKDCIESFKKDESPFFKNVNDLSKLERDYALKMRNLCEEYLELTEGEKEGENV